MNKVLKISRGAFLVVYPLLCLGAGGAAVASIIIDTLSQVQGDFQFVNDAPPPPPMGFTPVPFSEQGPFTQVLGGYRELILSDVTGDSSEDAAGVVFDSALSYSNGASISSKLQVIWDGPGSTGLGGIDITRSKRLEAIAITFQSASQNSSATFEIFDTLGNSSQATYTFATPECSTQTVLFVYNEQDFNQISNPCKALFDPNSSVNFGDVDKIILGLGSPPNSSSLPGIDIDIPGGSSNPIRSENIIAEIPEPTTSLLAFIGLTAFGAVMKRRKVESDS